MTLRLPKIETAAAIRHDGELLRLEREWDDGTLSITRVRSDRPFLLDDGAIPTTSWFLTEYVSGTLTIADPGRSQAKSRDAISTPGYLAPDDPRYPEARRVQFVLQAIDTAGCLKSNAAVGAVVDRIFTGEAAERYGDKPCASTVRKWMDTRGKPYARTLEACAGKTGKGPRRKRDEELVKLRTDAALYYWSAEPFSYEDAHAEHEEAVGRYNKKLAEQGLSPVPPYSLSWIRSRCDELESWDTWATKFGVPSANARFKAGKRGQQASFAGEIGIIDHKTWDNLVGLDMVGDDMMPMGRPTVTAVYDVRTGTVSAVLSMTPPSLFNMLDAIKFASRPKLTRTKVAPDKYELLTSIYTRFDTILPDNAWEFTGVSGQDSLGDLGCHIDWSRAGMPQDKAKLERFWYTLDLYLAKKLPATLLDPKILKKLEYDPTKDKVVLVSVLRDLLAEAVAFYHISINSGLGAQPARLWEKERKRLGPPPIFGDFAEIDKLMGMVRSATLTTGGIKTFKNLNYGDLQAGSDNVGALLARLTTTAPKGRTKVRNRLGRTSRVRVKIKFNPNDISCIHVWNHVDNEYVTLSCLDPEYAQGLSLRMHETVLSWVGAENLEFNTPHDRAIARATLNAVIREAAPHAAIAHRKRMARLLETESVRDGSGNAHVPSQYSGIIHDAATGDRSDGGVPPSAPTSHAKKKGSGGKSRRKSDEDITFHSAPPAPETGFPTNQSHSLPAPEFEGGDWGGLS